VTKDAVLLTGPTGVGHETMSADLLRRPDLAARRLREGREFVGFLNRRPRTAVTGG
jgi:hypothetical protein